MAQARFAARAWEADLGQENGAALRAAGRADYPACRTTLANALRDAPPRRAAAAALAAPRPPTASEGTGGFAGALHHHTLRLRPEDLAEVLGLDPSAGAGPRVRLGG